MDPGSLVLLSVLSFALDASDLASDRVEIAQNQHLALGAAGMWKGYRGSSHSRPGLRQHSDGFWYPKRAFEPVCVDLHGAKACVTDHIGWCRSKYWSYRLTTRFSPMRVSVGVAFLRFVRRRQIRAPQVSGHEELSSRSLFGERPDILLPHGRSPFPTKS